MYWHFSTENVNSVIVLLATQTVKQFDQNPSIRVPLTQSRASDVTTETVPQENADTILGWQLRDCEFCHYHLMTKSAIT